MGDAEAAIAAITTLAESVFGFQPFAPDPLPDNWKAILRTWLLGQSLAATITGQDGDTLQFIENGLVYKLPWAMEALRVRATANGEIVGQFGMTIDDYELGWAVPAVETGTMNRSASILIQAGFNSRLAAIKVVTDTGAVFTTQNELREWLQSPIVVALTAIPDWPSIETRTMWLDFARQFTPREDRIWTEREISGRCSVVWRPGSSRLTSLSSPLERSALSSLGGWHGAWSPKPSPQRQSNRASPCDGIGATRHYRCKLSGTKRPMGCVVPTLLALGHRRNAGLQRPPESHCLSTLRNWRV